MGKTTCGIAPIKIGAASQAELKLSLALLGFSEHGNCDSNEFYTAFINGNTTICVTISLWEIRGYIIHAVNKRIVYIPAQKGLDKFIHVMLNRLKLFEGTFCDEWGV